MARSWQTMRRRRSGNIRYHGSGSGIAGFDGDGGAARSAFTEDHFVYVLVNEDRSAARSTPAPLK